nr:PREDICTED: ankyrin-1-like [Bemisia tabaci]
MLFKNIKKNFESQLPDTQRIVSTSRGSRRQSNVLFDYVVPALGQVNKEAAIDRWELLQAAATGNIELLRSKLSKGSDVDARISVGAHVAGFFGNVFTYSDVPKDLPNSYVTPLHYAILNGHPEVAALLIYRKAQVNAKSNQGYTPLHLAAGTGCKDIAELLIETGANINVTSATGVTPLHLAAEQGHLHLVQLLILEGAKFNEMTEVFDFKEDLSQNYTKTHFIHRWTPLHFAINGNHFDVVKKMLHIGMALGIDFISPLEVAKEDFFRRIIKFFSSLSEPLDPYSFRLLSDLATKKKCSEALTKMMNKYRY